MRLSLTLLSLVTACGSPPPDDTGGGDTGGDTHDSGDTGGDVHDSGDTGGDTGGGGPPLLMVVEGSCADDVCTWSAESDGIIGWIELELAETGDPTATGGPGKELSECGFWEESHAAFRYQGPSGYGGDRFAIELAVVTDFTTQESDVSTLFDLREGATVNQLTVMFTLYDDTGSYADCAVYGRDPSWYASACTNVW